MSSFVRSSKFRNIIVTPFKRENTYENIQVSNGSAVSTGYGNCVDASTNFLAYIDKSSSGSCIGVLPHSSIGRRHVPVHAKTYKQPLIRANSSQVTTIQFTPHNESNDVLASGNMDGILSLFEIPEDGLSEDLTSPTRKLTLKGNSSTITSLQWHRAASNVIATAGNKEVHLWDVEKGEVICTNDTEHSTNITGLKWDWTGKRVLTSSKDNIVRLFDLRASESKQSIGSARGLKRMSICWAGKSNDIFLAVGHSARMERQCVLYDSRNLSKSLKTIRIDTNTSPMKALYDFDSNILFCCSRGDTTIKVFEHNHEKDPYLHPINSNSVSGSQTKDVCLMPKLAVDAKGCEIDRILRLTPGSIDPVRVEVPRKDKNRNFQDDLYPNTFSRKAAMTSKDYFDNNNDAAVCLPLTVSVEENSVVGKASSALRNRPGSLELKQKKAANSSTSQTSSDEVSSPMSAKANRANSLFAGQSKYKYVRMSCPNKEHTYFNLNIDTSVVDSMLISGSSRRFAIPWKRLAGGSIYLGDLTKANGGCHTSQCRSGGEAGRIAGGASRIAVNCSNQNSWKDNGKCGERINICIPNFKDMTLGLLDKFSTPGTTKQDDTAPSLIKKISCQYFNGLRLNNDNYVEFLVNCVVVKTSSKKFPSGKNVRIDIQTWDYNAELLNMKYLFRSPITNCYNKVFPCEFTGTYEAYGGDSTEEGHGGHGAPGTIYENCGDVNDRLTISNNHPNNRIVVPDGKTYLVNKANTSRKKLAATLITELRLMNNVRVSFEPLKLGRGSNAHLDIGYLLGHKTVLASAVFNLATNPSVADGRNTIFDRGKKILCPHILTALSSNRRCGQDTLY